MVASDAIIGAVLLLHCCSSPLLCRTQSPDGHLIGVGGIDGTVHMFDIETGKIVQTHEGLYVASSLQYENP